MDVLVFYSFRKEKDGAIKCYLLACDPCTSGHVTCSRTSGFFTEHQVLNKKLFYLQS